MVLDIFKNKNIFVFGLGVSAISCIKLLNDQGINVHIINQGDIEDNKRTLIDKGLEFVEVYSDQDSIDYDKINANYLILSPGIPRTHPVLKSFKGEIISEIEFSYQCLLKDFVSEKKTRIISLTGTNGKTTTVSFLDQCLKKSSYTHFTGGNIGTPLADYARDRITNKTGPVDYILLELSSFQLESMMRFTSDIAIINNLSFSHGERYNDLKEYALAKFNIFNRQNKNQMMIIPTELLELQKSLDLPVDQKAKKVVIDYSQASSVLKDYRDDIQIYGEHNLQNLYLAKTITDSIGIEDNVFINTLKSFTGVSYRLQKIYEDSHTMVFNDAKSTNWSATLTAINALKDVGALIPIIGGKLRGEGDFDESLFSHILSLSKLVILTGESGKYILEKLDKGSDSSHVIYLETLDDIYHYVKDKNLVGTIVYSPAFPSFDQFSNYIARGNKFNELFSEIK